MGIKRITTSYQVEDEHGDIDVQVIEGGLLIKQPSSVGGRSSDIIVINDSTLADLIDVLVEIDSGGSE